MLFSGPAKSRKGSPDPSAKGEKGKYFQKGLGKSTWKGKSTWHVYQPHLKQNSKGKDSPTKKGELKGKGKDAWRANWSRNNPNGTPFCRDYRIKKQCAGNCGRSHNCPVTKDGWVCNSPDACPYT